jgi:hypothetical protein
VSALGLSVGLGGTTASRGTADAPPPGLTTFGRVIWNLDALLHDTFGSQFVSLNVRDSYPRTPGSFSTRAIDNAHSRYYIFTFRDARRSRFRALRPPRPPRPNIGASGYEVPLTIRGAYIYCGNGRWLFEHGGNGPANWQVSCHK